MTHKLATCLLEREEHNLSFVLSNKILAGVIKQSKIRQVRRSPTFMVGYLIPRDYIEAMQFDKEITIVNGMMPLS